MVSLEEDPCENADSVIGNPSSFQWPATRGPSIEEEEEASKFAAEINAAVWNALTPLPVSAVPQAPQAPPPRWASIEDDEDFPAFMKMMGKEEGQTSTTEVFEWPATRGPSLDEFAGAPSMFFNLEPIAAPPVAPVGGQRVPEMFLNLDALTAPPLAPAAGSGMDGEESLAFMNSSIVVPSMKISENASDASTSVSRDEDQSLTTPVSGFSDDEGEAPKEQFEDTSATLRISLTDTLGLWSVGSAAHESGTCKPCAFLWKDLSKPGCQNGTGCVFCHLCPPGEVKKRKKQKMFMRKVAKNLHYMEEQYGMGYEPQFEPQYQNQFVAGVGMW